MAKKISASVGKGGKNSPIDIKVIQELLINVAGIAGGARAALKVDGIYGPKTVAAIEKFQLIQFDRSEVDGRVEPGSRTLQKLNELVFFRS